MRYILGLLATIGLIILILVLLLRGGGSDTPTQKVLTLSDHTSNSTAHFTVDGPIVADEKHQITKIDVDANQVTLTLYKGYQGEIIKQQTYTNNSKAYTAFLKGLQEVGFTHHNLDETLKDERGRCPTGQRRIYSLTEGSKDLMRSWSTSCGEKTFNGNVGSVRKLFQDQVPDIGKQLAESKFTSFY